MIHEIGVELQTQLRARGVPFPVVDGPEPTTTATWGRERIVIEYDADSDDEFSRPRSQSAPRSHGGTPIRRYSSLEACKATIYAQSAATGANVFEHRRRAKAIRDRVLVSLEAVAADRKNAFDPTRGRFVVPVDLQGAVIPGGAAYEISFGFERAIEDRAWDGSSAAEGNIAHVGSTTEVHGPGGEGDGETACGS